MTRGRGNWFGTRHRSAASSSALAQAGPTLEQFMVGWLQHVAQTRRPTTFRLYEGVTRRYVIPVIGSLALSDLRREHVDAVLGQTIGRLNPNTRRLLRAILGIALNRAERWEIAGARNVVRLTDPPRVEPREWIILRAAEARRLLQALPGNRLAIVYVLGLLCGLRRGEILALRWRDVDLEAREIHIRNTLHEEAGGAFRLGEAKSMSSRRSIPMSVTVAAALAEHRAHQLDELRTIATRRYPDTVDWDLVVTSRIGKPLSKSTLRGNFHRLLRTAGLPVIRIHDLRHSCASLLLLEGVGAQTVANFLGHSEVKTTLNFYGHVARSQSQDAAIALDRLLGHQHAVQQTLDFRQGQL